MISKEEEKEARGRDGKQKSEFHVPASSGWGLN